MTVFTPQPLQYMTVTGRIGDIIADGLDADDIPDEVPVKGQVRFTFLIDVGDAILMPHHPLGPKTSLVESVEASFDSQGRLTFRGETYVKLWAPDEWTNPAVGAYRVDFTNLSYDSKPLTLRSVVIPAVAGSEVDLTEVYPAPGTPGTGITRGERGVGVDGVTIDGNDITFSLDDNTDLPPVTVPALAQAEADAAAAHADRIAADGSASVAAGSASSASTSAGTATTKAGEASASAAAALASKNAAGTSETNAGTSAAAALASKNAAGTSETNALASKNAAGTSATNAATSETNALASKNAAATSATNAGTSETNANTAKTAAQAAQAGAELARDQAASGVVPDGGVTTIKVVDGAITSAKIADGTIVDADVNSSAAIAQSKINGLTAALSAKEATANKGAANGYAPLDGSAKIAATYLPAYVDDVLEYANLAGFPATGSTGLLYVALDTNKIYRWSGSAYAVVSETLVVGTTAGTAAAGNDARLTDTRTPTVGTIPFDVSFVARTGTRATGLGDVAAGIKLRRAVAFSSAHFHCETADASGNLSAEVRKNGSATGMPAVTIAAASQVAGSAATGTYSFAAGDVLTVAITAVGATPGKGLVVDLLGLC